MAIKAICLLAVAAVFCHWTTRNEDRETIVFNAMVAIGCAFCFLLLCLGVMHLCG